VVLSTNIANFEYSQFSSAAGGDLRFSDSNETTALDYEIERWDTNGESFVWVNVPEISGTGTHIWAFWGNSSQTNPPLCTTNGAVWNDGFLAVWHMGQTNDAGKLPDATTNRTDASLAGDTGPAAGRIGPGRVFDGNGDYLLADIPGPVPQSLTLEAWICATNGGVVFSELGQGSINAGWHDSHIEVMSSGEVRVRVWNGSAVSLGVWPTGVYHHVAMTYDDPGDALVGYVNGVRRGALTYQKQYPGDLWYALGAMDSTHIGDGTYFDGWMDEVRISNVARSSNWIWAAWMSVASNGWFPAYGAVEYGAPHIENSPATNVTASSACLNGYVTFIGGEDVVVTVYWGASDAGTNWQAWDSSATLFGRCGVGPVSTNVTGLAAGTACYYRWTASNSYGLASAPDSEYFFTGEVTIRASDALAREHDPGTGQPDPGAFTVTRPDWATNRATTVWYAIGGSASNGIDYDLITGNVTIPAGTSNAVISISPILQPEPEGDETVILTIQAGAYLVGAPSCATVTIADAACGPWHVALTGNDGNSGTSWEQAFRSISTGLAHAVHGDTVYVSNGVYDLSEPLTVAMGVVVTGVGGSAGTILDGGGLTPILHIAHEDAVVRGFTIRNGKNTNDAGGGVILTAGTLWDCVVTNNRVETLSPVPARGGGVWMTSGLLTNCRIVANSCWSSTNAVGGGVCASGGVIAACEISMNSITGQACNLYEVKGGGAFLAGDAAARGCVVSGNTAYTYGWSHAAGGGFYVTGNAAVADCLVIANGLRPDAASHGAGIYLAGGIVSNCHVITNTCYSHYTFAGGVYIVAGVLADCVVSGNWISAGHVEEAGGVYQSGGRMSRCRILGNHAMARGSALWGGGGLSLHAGIAENLLVAYNTGDYSGPNSIGHPGGGINMSGGELVNATIVSNRAVLSPGGGLRISGGDARNVIVLLNEGNPANVSKVGGVFRFSCTEPLISGGSDTNNLAEDPTFLNAFAGDFHLRAGSPCVDAGMAVGSPSKDLDGVACPVDGDGDTVAAWDIGAYEFSPSSGPLQVNFNADVRYGLGCVTAVLTAAVSGSNTNGVYYQWNFGNGSVSGYGLGVVTNVYDSIGLFTVSLSVTNSGGESDGVVKSDYIWVLPDSDTYVSRTGGNVYPYDTWARAAADIRSAVEVSERIVSLGGAHRTVWIGDGRFDLGTEQVFIEGPVVVRSANGPAFTTVSGNWGTRCFQLAGPGAALDGLKITEGFASGDLGGGILMTASGTVQNCWIVNNRAAQGAGLYMSADGMVSNCVIRENYADGAVVVNGFGGGIWMSTGRVVCCDIATNRAYAHHAYGGGVYILGGLVENCTISGNLSRITGHTEAGGGIQIGAGTVRNCLVVGNRVSGYGVDFGGNGVRMTGGSIENCTIVENIGTNSPGGGVRQEGGTILNTIVMFNEGNPSNLSQTAGTFSFSCTTPLPTGGGNVSNIDANPLFRNRDAGLYTLSPASPCVNRGIMRPWMTGARDLAGNPRTIGLPDMGAYELQPSGTIIFLR